MRLRDITWVECVVGLLLAGVLATLILAVWGEVRGWAVKSGVVESKVYSPSWVETQYSGSKPQIAIPIVHPDRYLVTVVGTTAEGEQRARNIQVDQITYHSVKVGQKWTERGGFE